jgi:hypothetical protein
MSSIYMEEKLYSDEKFIEYFTQGLSGKWYYGLKISSSTLYHFPLIEVGC